MARKRDRRVAPSSDHHETGVKTPTRPDQFSEAAASDRKLMTIFIVFFVVIPAVSILVYRIKYAPNTDSSYPQFQEDGLVKTDVDYQEILDENSKTLKNESHRHYTYPVLAYITPWNSKGYEMAKRFTNKFTKLCPVWYDLKSQGTGLVLEGRHNADMGWISELRRNGNALVLPRVVLEAFPKELLKKKKLRDKAIDLIISECKEMEYDGIVLESWSRWAAYGILHDPEMRNKALQFIKQLGHALHSVSFIKEWEAIFTIGPPYSEKLQPHDFGPEDLQSLSDDVDGFSFMTYDYSSPHNPGPNAPLKWIRFTLQILLGNSGARALANKIFLGINFYGNDFVLSEGSEGGGAITGREYLSLLEKHKPKLQWEKNSGEHFFLYVDDKHIKHAVFYPSLMSISIRLEEARLQGVGISIWEIGQVAKISTTCHDSTSPIRSTTATCIERRQGFSSSAYLSSNHRKRNNICIKLYSHGDSSSCISSVRDHNLSETKNYAMEAFNAASLTPLSVLCERRSEPRKSLSLPTVSPLKISHSASTRTSRSATQEYLSRTLHGGIVLLSSVLSTGLARALTYQETLEQSGRSFSSDANGVLDSVIKFGTENPTIVAGSVTVLAVPLVLSLVLNNSKSWGVESAKKAYSALGDDENAQLLDIRSPVEFRQVGSPDIRGLSKKPVPIVYEGEDKPGFLKKLSLKFKEPENTTLFILDKFDGNSELVAELVTVNGFKAAYAIKDGAEGPRGWMNSGLPWIPPKKALSLDLGDLSDAISGALGEGSGCLDCHLCNCSSYWLRCIGILRAILQVLGSAALIQLVSKKLLFAEDRKQTLEQVDEFLTTKIAPKELVDELKDIGKALLPVPVTSKALPAPAEASPEPAVQNAEAAPQINSAPKTEARAEPVSGFSRPLSPYPTYPDLKPPTSPTPSQP
uniref:Chitinase domain-containing protein 1 n=1 Tax=Salix viminalis TaxID=40686 RepID=A0A6N2KL94_SALVM